jgi:hypothetical protein
MFIKLSQFHDSDRMLNGLIRVKLNYFLINFFLFFLILS